jgi:hypothetical protein
MTALHIGAASDILAATGEKGMQASAGELYWDWRRIVLAVGYVLVFLAGLTILVAGDPTGLILVNAAIAGVLFLHRSRLGVAIWVYVIVVGVVAITHGDDFGFYGVAAGLAFGLVALPIWSVKRAVPRPAYLPQSPFQPVAPVASFAAVPQPNSYESPMPTLLVATLQAAVPRIRTIGRIQILAATGDLTPSLIGKPVIGFLWLYLLARQARTEGDRLTRGAITDEVAHGVSDPRGRLRGYLRDLARLPEPFGQMVKVDDEMIGFELGDCHADFAALRLIAARVRQSAGQLEDGLLRDARVSLEDLGDGEFLPGFEDMEKRVTQGRGVAGQVVAAVRVQLDNMRADVANAVAKKLLDQDEPALAVSLLEPIVARSEQRDDLARTLFDALRDSGQHKRAAEIRRRFATGENS